MFYFILFIKEIAQDSKTLQGRLSVAQLNLKEGELLSTPHFQQVLGEP